MTMRRWIPAAERGCLTILLVWLVWLPLPFGSVVEGARIPLIVVPLAICAAAAFLRFHGIDDRPHAPRPPRAWAIWTTGGLLLLAVGALQLVPLPQSLLSIVSPHTAAVATAAGRVAELTGVAVDTRHPVSVDPRATALELFRLAALLAAFTSAAVLIRTHRARVALASVLCIAAVFEALYGVREAALQRYEIWGWVNRLIFNRVTGTFVNPNHFAHYVAIILPMALFLVALAWHGAGGRGVPAMRRLADLIEHRIGMAAFATAAAIACVAAVLLAASRGALLAMAAGLLVVAALLPGRRTTRVVTGVVATLAVITSLIVFLGTERTVSRFVPNEFERETLVGRRVGIAAAAGIWLRFPILGSGLGTFDRVVSMEQTQDLGKLYHHVHNDYMELAATGGSIAFVIALTALAAGYGSLVRATFGAAAEQLSWRRRAFQAAALASVTIAMIHALFDFNFFIPSNPATLAVIAGAAVAMRDHDRRTRR